MHNALFVEEEKRTEAEVTENGSQRKKENPEGFARSL